MGLVHIDQVAPGMITAAPVRNQRGQILVPEDVPLTDRLITGLRSWKVRFVDIADDSTGDRGYTDAERARIAAYVDEALALYPQAHPLRTAIQKLAPLFVADQIDNLPAPPPDSPVPDPPASVRDMDHVLRSSIELYTFPEVHQKILAAMNRPDVSIAEVGELIAYDTALSARLLKVANSAYYSLTNKLDTVSRAIMVIGMNDLRSMVLTSALTDTFGSVAGDAATMHSFWQHAIACGTLARTVAHERGYRDAERYYTMGLLHDLGKLLAYARFPETMSAIERLAFSRSQPIEIAERDVLGYTHTRLGAALLRQWNFPQTYVETTLRHHRPESSQSARVETAVVHTADALSHVMGYAFFRPSRFPVVDDGAVDVLGLDEQVLAAVVDTAHKHIADLIQIFSPASGQ